MLHRTLRMLPAAVLACTLCAATTPLTVVHPVVSDRDGGAATPSSFVHDPGETMFFSFQVDGYQASSQDRVHLTYKLEAFDPQGVPIVAAVSAEIEETLAAEDKNWKPAVHQEITIPPLAASGTYKLVVAVSDLISKASTTKEIPFEVHGQKVEPSDKLVIRNIRFHRSEEDRKPMEKSAYRPGETVWARFDIIGFKYGDANTIDVSYDVAVVAPGGKVLYSQPQADSEHSQSFYPKRFVPAVMSLTTKRDTRPGEYTVVLTAHDGVGNQTCEARQSFTIE
ncbi:MAG TPA: hypothetical protein VKR61_18445 [Bryobacteraceae bacterium]|nr:hypothetical protein [Bryobacteraceae bacterium]